MAYCERCNGPCGHDTEESCCWARAMAVKKFKKFVLHKYIIEVIFDVLVSVLSVITDIIALILYIKKGHWPLAALTAIPVLLPTLVFTNVYLADETKGYCKLPKKRPPSRVSKNDPETESATESTEIQTNNCPQNFESRVKDLHSKMDFHCGSCHFLCYSCKGVCGGIFDSIFHKDRHIRKQGVQMVRKSIKRLLKYFFGTFVLRFIALAWYCKALAFGIKAYREPKKYMKIARPNTHWSYELLVRLDFLQAALENAPQCVIQLYALLTYPDEEVVIGALTLLFSFMDFVRVSVSVQWDIHRGPIIAPAGCYGSIFWKLLNMSSWIFLYIGRSAALALIVATAKHYWSIAIPVVILVCHAILFAKLFSKAKYGVAAQKVMVSVFISIFFLPEFDSNELPVLTKFYYAVVHVQNVFFILPWNGIEFEYCSTHKNSLIQRPVKPVPKQFLNSTTLSVFSNLLNLGKSKAAFFEQSKPKECIIDPTLIIMAVPALTMIGIVMRLACSQKMAEFKKTIPIREDTMKMEERVANIYNKKWTSMTWSVLSKAFLRMLRKEVITTDEEKSCTTDASQDTDKNVYFISSTLDKEFKSSQSFIRETISLLSIPGDIGRHESLKKQRSMSVDTYGVYFRGKDSNANIEGRETGGFFPADYSTTGLQRRKSHEDIGLQKKTDDCSLKEENESEPKREFEIELVRVDCPDGPYIFEMSWI